MNRIQGVVCFVALIFVVVMAYNVPTWIGNFAKSNAQYHSKY